MKWIEHTNLWKSESKTVASWDRGLRLNVQGVLACPHTPLNVFVVVLLLLLLHAAAAADVGAAAGVDAGAGAGAGGGARCVDAGGAGGIGMYWRWWYCFKLQVDCGEALLIWGFTAL